MNSSINDYIIKNSIELAQYCSDDLNIKKVFLEIDIPRRKILITAILDDLTKKESKEPINDIGDNIIANFSEIGSAEYSFFQEQDKMSLKGVPIFMQK